MVERAISFRCGTDALVGILHLPDRAARDLGLLIVVGGPQYRVGSHRQFLCTARELAEAGYPVFRFDYRGMGDSEGETRTFEGVDDDIRAAVDRFREEVPTMRGIVLFGLCDGASAALVYAPTDPRIVGLALANPWVRTEQGAAQALARHYYGERLLQRSFWAKVVKGGFRPVESLRGLVQTLRRAREAAESGEPADFLSRMARGWSAFEGPVLVVLSGRDLTAREFQALCQQSAAWSELACGPRVETKDIEDADHTFSDAAALAQFNQALVAWLGKRSAS